MLERRHRPLIAAPTEVSGLLKRIDQELHPTEVWLFGSRARGEEAHGSDWDLLVVLPNGSSESLADPASLWQLAAAEEVPATLLATTDADLDAIWGLPNTIGWDLAREGLRLHVS